MEIRKPLIPELIRLEEYPQCLSLNSRREFYANPRALIGLESSIARPTDWLVFDERDGQTYALHFLPHKVPGAVHLRRSKSRTTALFGAGPLLAKRPDLRVADGRIREIPYTLALSEGEYPLFLLHIVEEENRPTVKRGRRSKGREGAVEG